MDDNINLEKLNNYMNCIDIIYWINLDRSKKRRENMEYILKNIDIKNQRINAIDGKMLSNNYIYDRLKNINRMRTKIEYACLLSHLDTIKIFSNSPYTNALILEDDISLEYVKYWNKSICDIIKNAPKDWDIIMLNYISKEKITKLYTPNINGKISSCQAYIINKKSAQKLMNKILLFDNKYTLNKNFIHTADDYIYSSLKTYVYKYPYFTYSIENDSTIHNWHLDYHNYGKVLALMNWQEIYDFKLDKKYKNILIKNKLMLTKNKYVFHIILIILLFFIILYTTKNHKNQSGQVLFY
jgi:GR25 family glycosyltransferase involved in LPS biosynthesis